MSQEIRVLRGGEMLVSGVAVGWFATLAERAVQGQRLNGIRNGLFETWAAEAADAAGRVRMTADVGSPALPIEDVRSSSVLVDPITAAQAAEMSGCQVRNITDLCTREVFGTARKVGGQWQIERAEVLARVEKAAS